MLHSLNLNSRQQRSGQGCCPQFSFLGTVILLTVSARMWLMTVCIPPLSFLMHVTRPSTCKTISSPFFQDLRRGHVNSSSPSLLVRPQPHAPQKVLRNLLLCCCFNFLFWCNFRLHPACHNVHLLYKQSKIIKWSTQEINIGAILLTKPQTYILLLQTMLLCLEWCMCVCVFIWLRYAFRVDSWKRLLDQNAHAHMVPSSVTRFPPRWVVPICSPTSNDNSTPFPTDLSTWCVKLFNLCKSDGEIGYLVMF